MVLSIYLRLSSDSVWPLPDGRRALLPTVRMLLVDGGLFVCDELTVYCLSDRKQVYITHVNPLTLRLNTKVNTLIYNDIDINKLLRLLRG